MTPPPPYRIRFATLADLPVLRTFFTATMTELAAPYPEELAGPEAADVFTRQAALALTEPTAETYCLVAESAGEIIGVHWYGIQLRDLGLPHRHAFTYTIYVLPAARRSPVAEDLIEVAAEHALSRGVTMCEMTRVAGRALRRGLGFEPFEVRCRAPLTTVLRRIEERRRRRRRHQERASTPAPAAATSRAPQPVVVATTDGDSEEAEAMTFVYEEER